MTKKTATAPKTATPSKAIAKADKLEVMPLSGVVDKFCEAGAFSPADVRFIHESVNHIREFQEAMLKNALAIGTELNNVRSRIGSDKFGTFARTILPAMGLSKSRVYDWMGRASILCERISNPIARTYLLTIGEGKGIVTAEKDDDGAFKGMAINPAYEKALKQLKAEEPTVNTSAKDAELWARKVVALGENIRRNASKGNGATADKVAASIAKQALTFAGKYGTAASAKLVEEVFRSVVSKAPDTERRAYAGKILETLGDITFPVTVEAAAKA